VERVDRAVAEDHRRTAHRRAGSGDTPSDLPEHCAPFLRTVLDVVCTGQTPTDAELLRLKDVTVELVDLLAQELQSNRDLESDKRAAQDDLNTQLFEHLMRLRPPWWIPTKRACWQTS
jgi:type I restriction enzyme R subunit